MRPCSKTAVSVEKVSNFFAQFSDAHAHLPLCPNDDDKIRVPANARILLSSTRVADFSRVAKFAEKFPGIIVPAFGVHPWFADEWSADSARELRKYFLNTKCAAMGEIGLDRCRENEDGQERAFREQLEIAAEFHVPAVVHCVRAFGKTEEILREFFSKGKLPPVLLHAYAGSAEQAKIFSKLGGVFSAPRKTLPSECIVVPETDAPLSVEGSALR